MKNIKLVEVRSELGAGTRGASLGIDALKLASMEYGEYFFGRYKNVEIKDSSRLLYKNPVRTHAKRIRGVVKIFNRLATTISKEIQANRFPVVLSGDHSSAGGTIAGVKMAHPEKRVGVIWIDAHADLHSPYTTPSGNIHGMPLATALAVDNITKAIQTPTDDTMPLWEMLKNIGNISPKITPQDLVFIGLRDYEEPEGAFIRKNRIRVVTVPEIRRGKIKEICKQVLAHLSHCDVLYISFDIDSLDKPLVPGTGTPVSGGLTLNEAQKILSILLKDPRLVCFEITEINPLLDVRNETALRIYPLFRSAVLTIEKQIKKKIKSEKK
jgi:arginase